MTQPLTDQELRWTIIGLLRMPTKRTLQTTIGASNLSNPCDRCLGYDMLNHYRPNPQAERTWLGKEIGTGIHGLLEDRTREVLDNPELYPELYAKLAGSNPEKHCYFAEIPGYGRVGGTIDLSMPYNLVDYKTTERPKLALFRDFMALQAGEDAPFGREHKDIKLSQTKYDEAIRKQAYKVRGYVGQLSLYGLGREYLGQPVDRVSIGWICRGGNGYFDVPTMDRYEDPRAHHDVWVTTFAYSREYALWLIDRGARIWQYLQGGGSPEQLEGAEDCWLCGHELPKPSLEPTPITMNGIPVGVPTPQVAA